MNAPDRSKPRWGDRHWDRKAIALLGTIVSMRGGHIKQGRWLDIGCGSGDIAATLAQDVGDITGIDPEPWPDWDAKTERHKNLNFLADRFDRSSCPVTLSTFDVVICNQVYEHVQDPAQLIRNIHGALKPGCICYFAGPNLLWPIEPHVFWPFVHWLPRPLASRIMTLLGSRAVADLDAFSLDYWRLTKLFRLAELQSTNAIKKRLLCSPSGGPLIQLARWVPEPLFKALTPLTPGFVFLLEKPVSHD